MDNDSDQIKQFFWDVSDLFNSTQQYAALILNHSLDGEINKDLLLKIWNNALIRVAVDGGSNKLLLIDKASLPDIISGDFDSILPSVLESYRKKKVKIIKTTDQQYTDFTKALNLIANKTNYVVAFWTNSGRFDHVIGIIESLHYWSKQHANKPLYLISLDTCSLSWLLMKGKHQIRSIPVEWCSLASFSGPSTVSSKGLVYNLNNTILSFGNFQSTSNKIDESNEIVTIETSNTILWSQSFDVKIFM